MAGFVGQFKPEFRTPRGWLVKHMSTLQLRAIEPYQLWWPIPIHYDQHPFSRFPDCLAQPIPPYIDAVGLGRDRKLGRIAHFDGFLTRYDRRTRIVKSESGHSDR